MATKLKDVCHYIRSKVAGPFWVTIDLMFDSKESFEKYSNDPALSATSIAGVYRIDPASVSHYPVPNLNVLKISYPRRGSQGGVEERDLHSGQQYVYILDLELAG
ncbi:DUF4387 domain-containing protein [Niveispirillum fermenti]|uniref:DUF4387 domain-containing protein n=1 Tax=Niveispirillum fermenti TaxID=1233113 RepID=UPI003A838605